VYEVVCPDGLVRHTPYNKPEDAEAYADFANRAGDGVDVPPGKDCEPNLPGVSMCKIPPPGNIQAHWVRVVETGKPLLSTCPVCGTRAVMPDKPVYDVRVGRKVIVDIRCTGCPAALTLFESTGHIVCFIPNQVLKVRRVRP